MPGLTRRFTSAVAAGLALSLAAGYLTPAYADDPVPITDQQVADILFGAAVRLADPGPDYDRNVVATAELLDWRAANPQAAAQALAVHLTTVDQHLAAGLTDTDRLLEPGELLGKELQILYATPGARIGGVQTGALLAVATARDLAPGVLTITERLSGAQQQYAVDVAYTKAQHDLWLELRKQTGQQNDGVLAAVWQSALGTATPSAPAGVNPTWTLKNITDNISELKTLLEVDKLIDAEANGADAFWTELGRQFQTLRDKMTGQQAALNAAIAGLLPTAGVPGKPNQVAPTQSQVDQDQKDQKDRQDIIDGVKAGMDALVWIATKIDAGFGKNLAGFADGVYKAVTAMNKLYSAVGTLAAAVGFGATLGAIGAIGGAVIGLIQVFVGLLGGDDPTPQQNAQQQIVNLIRDGFDQVKSMLQTIYATMNNRFDRIDAELSKVYQDMMSKFGTVINLLYDVRGDVSAVHAELLTLESRVQAFNQQLIDQVTDVDKAPFLNTAHNYVDYAFQNNHPLPNFDSGGNDYVTGVNRFTTTATSTARDANFTYPNLNQTDVGVAIGAHGPAGAIDWLAHHASAYGLTVPTPADRVPNPDLWAPATRAYTLTAIQNPQFAAQESDARHDQIEAAGELIRDTALKFSAPVAPPASGTWTATNSLFTGLLTENTQLRTQFVDSLPALEQQVMAPSRSIRLWPKTTGVPAGRPAVNQLVDVDAMSTNPTDGSPNRLSAAPATVGPCSGSGGQAPIPAAVTGRDLSSQLLLGLYADQSWKYGVCWTDAHWSTPEPKITQVETLLVGPKNGPKQIVHRYHVHLVADLIADFPESVAVPGSGTITGRVTTMKEAFAFCYWVHDGSVGPPPSTCHDTPGNVRDKMGGANFSTVVSATNPVGAGAAQAQALITKRQIAYYELVATKLQQNALPAARALNTSVQTLRAYADLGFPRAEQSDDQLRALLYGGNGLPSDLPDTPILEAVYVQAALNLKAGKAATQDQPLLDQGLGNCVPLGRGAEDPVAGCVWQTGWDRTQALADRIELHSKALYQGQEIESLPLVDEALRNLDLVHTFVRAPH